jgi:hypothetical protein
MFEYVKKVTKSAKIGPKIQFSRAQRVLLVEGVTRTFLACFWRMWDLQKNQNIRKNTCCSESSENGAKRDYYNPIIDLGVLWT